MGIEYPYEVLKKLKSINLSTYPVDEIRAHIRQLRSFPTYITSFYIGNVVYRIRSNEKGESFKTIADLSYKPQQYNTTYQRVSCPERTMFYGSIIPPDNKQSEIGVGRVIALAEGSKLFRNNQIEEGQEVVTFGMWRLQDTVKLATILHPDIKKNISPFAIESAKEFIAWLSQSPDEEEERKKILEFYADEFSKVVEMGEGDYNYLHSALLTEVFLKKGFDGVVYSSTRVEEKGLNVAIKPDFVDAFMRIEGVMECMVVKRNQRLVCDTLKKAWIQPGQTEINFEIVNTPEQVLENIDKRFLQ